MTIAKISRALTMDEFDAVTLEMEEAKTAMTIISQLLEDLDGLAASGEIQVSLRQPVNHLQYLARQVHTHVERADAIMIPGERDKRAPDGEDEAA